MLIQYLHASMFGNGVAVADQFQKAMTDAGATVTVRHIRDAKPARLQPADLYVFSSPGRMGRPRRNMRRFLRDLSLPAGTRYALLTTEMAPPGSKKSGPIPQPEEPRGQRVRPIMNEILQGKGMIPVAEEKIFVTGLKGPLEEGWQRKVAAFAAALPVRN